MASSWEPLATCRVQRTLLEDREWEGGWGGAWELAFIDGQVAIFIIIPQ